MTEDSGEDQEEFITTITELDWMAKEILLMLNEADDSMNVTEIRLRLGEENVQNINYRVNGKLEPIGVVEVERSMSDNGQANPKKLTLTTSGESAVEILRSGSGKDNDPAQLPLDKRLERLESAIESEYGAWSSTREHVHRYNMKQVNIIQGFLMEKCGDEFGEYFLEELDEMEDSG